MDIPIRSGFNWMNFLTSDQWEEIFRRMGPELQRTISLTPAFWASLAAHRVITVKEIEEIQDSGTATPPASQTQINQLLQYVTVNNTTSGLMRALVDTEQRHIVDSILQVVAEFLKDVPLKETRGDLSKEHLEAYRNACDGGTKQIYRSRVVLVGHFGSGKTNLKRCLLKEPFIETHDKTNSIEADPSTSRIDVTKTRHWKIHDVKDEYGYIVAAFIHEKVNEVKDPDVLLSGNVDHSLSERDTEEQRVMPPTNVVEALLRKALEENDDDSTKPVELFFCDFGGQREFYITHMTFLTRQSIYILVMDLTKGLEHCLLTERRERGGTLITDTFCPEKVKDYLEFWCSCIHTFVEPTVNREGASSEGASECQGTTPAIVIVCTHKDECTDQEARRYAAEVWKFVESKSYRKHIVDILTISNKNRDEEDINKLKDIIVSLAKNQGYQLPLRWVDFKEKLMRKTTGAIPRRTWEEALEIAQGLGMTESDVAAALTFFHEVGDVVFFQDKNLRNFIITQPQWLIEQFRKIITIPEYKGHIKDPLHRMYLDKAGLLHEAVLQDLWSENVGKDVVNLMKKFALLIPLNSKEPIKYALDDEYPVDMKTPYLVPCLLPPVDNDNDAAAMHEPLLLIPSGRFLPIGLTSRLIAGLINDDGWQLAGNIYRDFAQFFPRGQKDSSIKVCVRGNASDIHICGKSVDDPVLDADFRDSLQTILKRLAAITSSVCPQRQFSVGIYCPVCQRNRDKAIISFGLNGKDYSENEYCKKHGKKCKTTDYTKWFKTTTQASGVEVKGRQMLLWDRDFPKGGELLIRHHELDRMLSAALPDLKKTVRPGDLWAYLQRYGVMQQADIDECQTSAVRGQQVENLVKFLKEEPVWKTHAFFRALAQTEQGAKIDVVLGAGAKDAYNKNLQDG